MKAADIMSSHVFTIESWATITQAAQVMQQHDVRALIVNRNSEEDAYGIVTQTDIGRAIADTETLENTFVYEVMTKPCIVINPDLAVEHIAKLFARARIRIAPVIKDKLLGILSLTDILTKTNCLTSTNCLSSIEDEFIAQTNDTFEEFPLDEIDKTKLPTGKNLIYENWCSG